ncbi:MAG: RimK family alpha-L-glutamate ligase [Clostridia bacterium]|nr:RimK family alpha-L-glutamate ligase [Clostridia bacterium]
MNGIICYNSYNKMQSYLDNINMYYKAILNVCDSLKTVSSAQIMPIIENGSAAFDNIDFALFLDKDICLAKLLENSGVRVFNSSLSIASCDNKAYTHSILTNSGINMPKTYITPFTFNTFGYPNLDFLDIIDFFPVVVKQAYGSLGQQVYLAKNKSELLNIAKNLPKEQFLVQEYIECGNSDTRVFMCGGKAKCAMKRHNSNDFRSNAELGGVCTKVSLDEKTALMAENASKLLGLDFCGIDIINSGENQYLLEVNSNVMINSLAKVTGINPADYIAEHILKTIKGQV